MRSDDPSPAMVSRPHFQAHATSNCKCSLVITDSCVAKILVFLFRFLLNGIFRECCYCCFFHF